MLDIFSVIQVCQENMSIGMTEVYSGESFLLSKTGYKEDALA